jgi:hypothetical protein
MKALVIVLVVACGAPSTLAPSATRSLPEHKELSIDTTPKERRRMLPPEAYLRAYLAWFGGLAPLDVQQRAKPRNLFDAWDDYLSALGLPDYKIDIPRQVQSNTLMLATLGRLGEALCVRAAERDRKAAPDDRIVFRFDMKPPSEQEFATRFDVLHETFLGYPARFAPPDRISRFFALFQAVASRHANPKQPLTGSETAWAAVCAGLVQHPEVELY